MARVTKTVRKKRTYAMAKTRKRVRPADRPFYLKEWRKALKVSGQKLADALDTSKSRVSEIENGVERWNEDFIWDCAQALGIPAYKLLSEPPDRDAAAIQEIHTILTSLPTRARTRALRHLRAILEDETDAA